MRAISLGQPLSWRLRSHARSKWRLRGAADDFVVGALAPRALALLHHRVSLVGADGQRAAKVELHKQACHHQNHAAHTGEHATAVSWRQALRPPACQGNTRQVSCGTSPKPQHRAKAAGTPGPPAGRGPVTSAPQWPRSERSAPLDHTGTCRWVCRSQCQRPHQSSSTAGRKAAAEVGRCAASRRLL